MHQVSYGKHKWLVPESWAECPADLIPIAAKARLSESDADRVELAIAMLGGRRGVVRQMRAGDLVLLTAWAFEQRPELARLEKILVAGTEYFLPKHDLSNVKMLEFALAELLFRQYIGSRSPDDLTDFLSILVRPGKSAEEMASPSWDGDKREQLNSALSEIRKPLFKQVTVSDAAAVCLLWMTGIEKLQESFPSLFKKAPKAESSLLELIYDLAERGTYGTFEQTAATSVYTVYLGLNYANNKALSKK